MRKEALLKGSRWRMLEAIAGGKRSSSEIAKEAKTSLPNVTQQLRLLEAHGMIAFEREEKSGLGKPRNLYSLTGPLSMVALVKDGLAKRQLFTPTPLQELLLSILLIKDAAEQHALVKFLMTNEEILSSCAVAHVKSSSDEVEVLLMTEKTDDIRKKYSNATVDVDGKTVKIVAWTHSRFEVEDGLSRKDSHFAHLLKAPIILHDPDGTLAEVVNE